MALIKNVKTLFFLKDLFFFLLDERMSAFVIYNLFLTTSVMVKVRQTKEVAGGRP